MYHSVCSLLLVEAHGVKFIIIFGSSADPMSLYTHLVLFLSVVIVLLLVVVAVFITLQNCSHV